MCLVKLSAPHEFCITDRLYVTKRPVMDSASILGPAIMWLSYANMKRKHAVRLGRKVTASFLHDRLAFSECPFSLVRFVWIDEEVLSVGQK